MHQFGLKLKVGEKERWFCAVPANSSSLEAEGEKAIVECPFCSFYSFPLDVSIHECLAERDFFQSLLRKHAATAKSLQSSPTLCDLIDSSPPGCPVPGILQARTLKWVAISFSNAWKWKVKVKSLSRNPMDCSPPGSSVHGIFQARVLEWGAIAFSEKHREQ